jgi:prepilin signal peptidase PulO-like enzyme (type II secretory pathway)
MSFQPTSVPHPTHNMPTIWRKKSVLVMTKQAQLPERCIKCNAPTRHTLKRNLRWHHPAIYILIVAGFLFYAILALALSKTATVHVGLCETHVAARRRDILITWLLVVLSFVTFYLAVASDEMTLLFVSVGVLLGGVIYGVVRARVVAPQKIDDHYVWLTGINTNYLQQFPDKA